MPTNDVDAHGQVAWSWHPDADAKSVLMLDAQRR
jgi:mannose/fructose/N-acetylgalactosamine-specific phosphotransferase system component IIB